MKSIEEVIKAFEWCLQDDDADCIQCPYYEGKETDCHNRNVDALQYLKEYQADKESLENCRKLTMETYGRYSKWIENFQKAHDEYMKKREEFSENPPLEWSQLQGMLGQPIWIEGANGSMWGIVAELYKDMFGQGKITLRTMKSGRLHLNQKNLGTTWNAYRKEKK